jgi:hypothetical protein
MDDVSFTYPGNTVPTINNVSVRVGGGVNSYLLFSSVSHGSLALARFLGVLCCKPALFNLVHRCFLGVL